MHQNTEHYVRFMANQSLNTSVLPRLPGFPRVQSHGDQLLSLRTYYCHHVSPPTSIIGTRRTTQQGPPPRSLRKPTNNPAGAQTLYLPTGKKCEKQENIYTYTFSYYTQLTLVTRRRLTKT